MRRGLDRRAAGLLLSAIIALALLLRLLWLRTDSTFQRTDEVMFILNALQLSSLAPRDVFWTLAFPWGYPVLFVILSVLSVYQWLGIPIRETTIVAPFAVLGALGPFLLYRLARRAFSRGVALTAALALAVLPSHVAQSRAVGAWILASDLMMLTIVLAWRYLQRPERDRALVFAAALAIYLPADNLAPGTLLLLAAMALGWRPGPVGERVRAARAALTRPAVIVLPALSLGVLVAVQAVFVIAGRPTYGFLGHYLAGKVQRGLHLGPVLAGLGENLGPPLAVLAALGFAWGLTTLTRPGRAWLFFAWLLSFALPTILLIDPAATVPNAYLTPIVGPLLVLGSAALFTGIDATARWIGRGAATAAGAAALGLAFGLALALLASRVYERAFLFPLRPIGLWGGEIYHNDGAKAAGYWIRRNTAPGTVVLSDLRLFVGKYYFHRPTVGLERAAEVGGHVGVIALRATGPPLGAPRWMDGFSLAATVIHAGRPALLIYTREPGPAVTLATEEFDGRFDREFARLDTLRFPTVWEDDPSPAR